MPTNLLLLFVAQLITASGGIVMVTLAGILGAGMAPTAELATLPASAGILGTALMTVPAALFMRRVGRRVGFCCAALMASSAAALAAWAIARQSFVAFLAASVMFGFQMAFALQYRFAAAESVSPQRVSRAVSGVLLGSIGGALLGPLLIRYGKLWLPSAPYAGTMLAVAGLYLLSVVVLSLLRPARLELPDRTIGAERPTTGRPILVLLRQSTCRLAIAGAMAAYGVMALIMTATPLSMHLVDGFSIEQTSEVIRAHVLAMYGPSLLTGILIERLGVGRMMMAGVTLLLTATAIGLAGQQLLHYAATLVLLGVGWNLLFIGATTLLTRTYRFEERFKVQAVNDLCVFGTSAVASLLAGWLIHALGWTFVMTVSMPVLIGTGVALYRSRSFSLLRTAARS